MELKANAPIMTTVDDDEQPIIEVGENSWMESLPEVSTYDYSPQSAPAGLTFGPSAGRQAKATLTTFGVDNPAADNPAAEVEENDDEPQASEDAPPDDKDDVDLTPDNE